MIKIIIIIKNGVQKERYQFSNQTWSIALKNRSLDYAKLTEVK